MGSCRRFIPSSCYRIPRRILKRLCPTEIEGLAFMGIPTIGSNKQTSSMRSVWFLPFALCSRIVSSTSLLVDRSVLLTNPSGKNIIEQTFP